ncbi:MAG: thiolase family protein [Dehalococcoidia bacterium]|nr:thiolase family protein [Dehalococcoidia bacterium]
MGETLRGKAAIVGFGDSYADEAHKKTPLHLAAQATRAALQDAGLRKDDLDGLLTGREPSADARWMWNTIFAAYVKITPQYSTQVNIHSAGINAMLKHAAAAVHTGLAKHVLCVSTDAAPLWIDPVKITPEIDADPQFELPYGPIIPALYAQAARRYMYEFGITEEHLARVAVSAQDWAIHHPYAAKAKFGKITMETVMNSRMIASPLRLWHCAMWGPGGTGGAFIVTTSERAQDMTDHPIYILGSGECVTHEYITDRLALRSSLLPLGKLPNITTTGAKIAAQRAYAMAEMGPWDADIVQTAGNFAHVPLLMLEDLGFCEKGGAGSFVDAGHIDFDGGDLPFNTNGGWLSFGQPGTNCVGDSLVEAVRQLRGCALGKQVPGAKRALIHGLGGMLACHSVTILGTER